MFRDFWEERNDDDDDPVENFDFLGTLWGNESPRDIWSPAVI